MSARGRTRRALGALAIGGASAAACVEITAAEGGVQSVVLSPVPPSIIAGDVLRDSLGRVTRLSAIAFDASGDTVRDARFTFGFQPLVRDSIGGVPALTVDETGGAVNAAELPRAARARVSARYGDRLQIFDTIAIVRRPTSIRRGSTPDTGFALPFLCNDSSRGVRTTLPFATASASLPVVIEGDSAGQRVVVPSYLVRYRIVSPATIPTGPSPFGDVRPALYMTDARFDRPLNYDTTNAAGQTAAQLRVVPTLLRAGTTPDTVLVEASIVVPNAPVDSTVRFVVRLQRRTPTSGSACP